MAQDAPLLARIHQLRNAAEKKDVDACVEHGQAIANECVGGDERVQMWMLTRGWNKCLRMDITCTPTMHRLVTTLLFAKLAMHQEDSAGSLAQSDQASLAEWCLERNLTPLVAMVLMTGLSDRIFEQPDWCGGGSGDGLWRIYRAPCISEGDEPEDTFVRCFMPVKNFKEQLHQVVGAYKTCRGWDTWAAYQPRRLAYGPTQLILQREESTGVFNTVVAAVVAAKRKGERSRMEFPILMAGGGPGIGKSRFLDQLGRAAREVAVDGVEVAHLNLSFMHGTGATPTEAKLPVGSMVAVRLLHACFSSKEPLNSFESRHLHLLSGLSTTEALHFIAETVLPGTTVLFVVGVDEVQEAKVGLGDLFQVMGNAMVGCRHPLVWMAAGLNPVQIQRSIDSSGHPHRSIDLPWLTERSRLQVLALLHTCEPWWLGEGDSQVATSKVKMAMISSQYKGVPLLAELLADTSGHPRMLIVLVQVLVEHLIETPHLTQLADANVAKTRRFVRGVLRTRFERVSSGVFAQGFSKERMMTIIAHAVGNVPVVEDEDLVPGFTPEQLQANGVLHVISNGDGTAAITLPFLMLQVWVVEVQHKFDRTGTDTTPAIRDLLWSLRQWFKLESDYFSPAINKSTPWEAVAACLTCVRANAICVVRKSERVDMKLQDCHRGAVVGQALLDADVSIQVSPVRFVRVDENLEWGPSAQHTLVSPAHVWGSHKARRVDWSSPPCVLINGESGTGLDIVVVRPRAPPAAATSVVVELGQRMASTSRGVGWPDVVEKFSKPGASSVWKGAGDVIVRVVYCTPDVGIKTITDPARLQEKWSAVCKAKKVRPLTYVILVKRAKLDAYFGPLIMSRPIMCMFTGAS